MRWQQGDQQTELAVDFASLEHRLEVSHGSGGSRTIALTGRPQY